jgi:hypothetical protein
LMCNWGGVITITNPGETTVQIPLTAHDLLRHFAFSNILAILFQPKSPLHNQVDPIRFVKSGCSNEADRSLKDVLGDHSFSG